MSERTVAGEPGQPPVDGGAGPSPRSGRQGEAAATIASGGPSRTAVLGGGALGLTVALRLAQRGEAVTVFEREPEAGGLASGFRPAPELPDGGPFLEKFYHHLFRSDTAVTALIEELGLGGRMVWPTPINAVVRGGRIWQPYTPLGLLKFSLLPLLDRARMAAALAYLKVQRNYRQFAGWTAHDWLRRWMGERAYNVLWNPLLRAKFGERFDRVAMPWFWARIHYRSFELGYLDGGFQLLYEALVAEIRRLGGDVHLGTEVVEARYENFGSGALASEASGGGQAPALRPLKQQGDSSWTVAWRQVGSSEAQKGQFERVVSTLPTRLTIRLIPQLPDEYKRQYDWGEAYGAHCLVLALDRPMMEHGEYWLNVNDPGFPFLVLVEHTNYRPPAAYGGKRLVYLGNYLPMDHPLFRKTKEEILAEFLPALRRINPAFEEKWVQESWSFGAPYAQPIVTREYPEHIPPLKGPLPGLWIGSMFQVYPQDRGQNYSVALANRLVGEILGGRP